MQLRCKAPHPNPIAHAGECSHPNLWTPRGWELDFVGFVERAPEIEDEFLYVPCKRKHCNTVSVYKLTAVKQVA